MKNTIKYFALALALLLSFGCSKEYLDTYPEYAILKADAFATTKTAAWAVNGLCRLQSTSHPNSGQNGEATIMLYYGNYPGQHFQKCNRTGLSYLMNQTYHLLLDNSYDIYPWYYYYKLILNANLILENVDGAKGPDNEKEFIKAQALTFRAWSFFRLSELYCWRWQDSKGDYKYKDANGDVQTLTGVYGAIQGVPLRLESSTGDLPCAYLREVRDQVYADLDQAITYYKSCGIDRERNEYYKPNLDVAYAIYARAALTYAYSGDPESRWDDIINFARLARKNYPLMSNTEYLESGFNKANDEWIWGTYDAPDENISTSSFYGYMASNGTTSNTVTYPSAISKELYDRIPATDVRRGCYLEPHPGEIDMLYYPTTGRSVGPLAERAKREFGHKLYLDKNGQLISSIYIYMQFKFQAAKLPAVGCVCVMRSAEMYYIEMEALYRKGGNEDLIRSLLNEVNQDRNPSYNCTLSGSKLWDEVKLYRAFDLWGEGLDWFDMKRWRESISRKSLANGGSFHASFAKTIGPTAANRWTWIIPRRETDYNKAITVVGGIIESDD